jgi:hypothetical protein
MLIYSSSAAREGNCCGKCNSGDRAAATENDPLAKGTQTLFDTLKCEKSLVRFPATESAGDHCEMLNRSAVNRVALDWLDEVLRSKAERLQASLATTPATMRKQSPRRLSVAAPHSASRRLARSVSRRSSSRSMRRRPSSFSSPAR